MVHFAQIISAAAFVSVSSAGMISARSCFPSFSYHETFLVPMARRYAPSASSSAYSAYSTGAYQASSSNMDSSYGSADSSYSSGYNGGYGSVDSSYSSGYDSSYNSMDSSYGSGYDSSYGNNWNSYVFYFPTAPSSVVFQNVFGNYDGSHDIYLLFLRCCPNFFRNHDGSYDIYLLFLRCHSNFFGHVYTSNLRVGKRLLGK